MHVTPTGVENMTTNVNVNNDSSSRDRQEQPATSCSTPVARKSIVEVDDSPDIAYSPSPILPPCTQEGGNEVAWDWHCSLSRSPESRSRKQRAECETPKGTKLPRKRISNSPLLRKPRKRKTMKIENMQSIAQFSADLQALDERMMRVIEENDKNHLSNLAKEEEAPTLMNTIGEIRTSEIKDDKENNVLGEGSNRCNSIGETSGSNMIKKESSGNYDDLFDDSVDEDMIRCTQEIEEKFSLIDKGNSTQVKAEEECTKDITKTSVQSSSSEDYKKPLVRNVLGAGDNTMFKTYSRLSIKYNTNSSINVVTQEGKSAYKPCPNNNNIIHSPHIVKKPCDNKKLLKSNTVELFDLPEDSFDDWFADCDEKLFSQSNGTLARENGNTKFQSNYKCLTNAPLKSETKSADLFNPEASNATFANRKFFKTKSLSEQFVNRGANTNAKDNRINAARPMHLNSSKGTHASVSTKPIVTNDRRIENNPVSLMHNANRTRGYDVNRCAVKSDGDRFVKHHSTGNIKNDRQETTKTGSQPARCSAEEIERKRLQALAKLEAKRKLVSMKITNNINR